MLKEQEDYYLNEDGNFVFTENYHLKRGFCCKNVCKHCPWSYKKKIDQKNHKQKKI
jgi:biotin synthase-like enzyme